MPSRQYDLILYVFYESYRFSKTFLCENQIRIIEKIPFVIDIYPEQSRFFLELISAS